MKRILSLFLIVVALNSIKAQDTLQSNKKLYYRFTIGIGIGSGYPLQEDEYGIGANMEFAFQKNNAVYGLGARGLQEFDIFASSNIIPSISSIDITYGKSFNKKSFFVSVSVGAGWVTDVQPGKLLSYGSGFFGPDYYEKITNHTIGLPISAKIFWVPFRFYGIGLELYANINSKNTFYGINICHQFGKLRHVIKKK